MGQGGEGVMGVGSLQLGDMASIVRAGTNGRRTLTWFWPSQPAHNIYVSLVMEALASWSQVMIMLGLGPMHSAQLILDVLGSAATLRYLDMRTRHIRHHMHGDTNATDTWSISQIFKFYLLLITKLPLIH